MENNIENDVETVGEILRNARLKNGKTISDVAEDLCIRKVYLTAIEEMDFANIPEMPYGLGFIRSYAQYLGLNSDRIIASYRQVEMAHHGNKLTDDTESVEASKPNFKHIVFGIIGLALVVAAWFVLSSHKNESLEIENSVEKVIEEPEIVDMENEQADITDSDGTLYGLEKTIVEEVEGEEEVIQERDDVATNAPQEEQIARRKLRFELTGPSWLELRQGEKIVLRGLYKKGFSYEIPNVADTYITVGRHHSVQFYINDEPVNVVSAMKKKNVKLDEYMKSQD